MITARGARSHALAAVLTAVAAVTMSYRPALQGQAMQRQAHPDFHGIWNSSTVTPLERPRELGNTAFFTPEEAAAFERRSVRSNEEPTNAQNAGTGTYNTFFREFGTRTVKTLRTSIVIDPPDGRIPPLTPTAAERKRLTLERQRRVENAEDLGLQDQCLAFSTAGPPMLPYSYNSNYQIVQTNNAVMIYAEMNHDARVVYMDGRPHPSPAVRQWMGHSTGRWEDATLVIETTNFNQAGGFYGSAGGNFGWDENLRVTERLRLLDANTLLYQFDIDNPSAFTAPWKGELTMIRSNEAIFEYACHEGNYALTNLLRGYRATEGGRR